MKYISHLLILLFTLNFSQTVVSQEEIQWVEIGEGTYDHGFIFPYKLKLSVPFGVRDIDDLKEGLFPMLFELDWLPIELKQKKVQSIFHDQIKTHFKDKEGFVLSVNIIEQFILKLPEIKKHDKWVFEYLPDEGTKLFIQEQKVHQLVGAELNRALIQSWINKNPMLTSNLFNRLLKVQ